MMDFENHPHRRYNPLTSEWVLVSPHRTRRPWQGFREPAKEDAPPAYDPDCYLCPGNKRAGKKTNPDYSQIHVFDNDFAALLPDTQPQKTSDSKFFKAESVQGVSRVICFSPRHNLTLTQMPVAGIRMVVDAWADQFMELGKKYRWVQIFENKGEIMGCSNPHPHCQVWAADYLPNEPKKEDISQRRHTAAFGKNLLVGYSEAEQACETRVVVQNDYWLVVVPFWAVWPFETLLMPKRHVLQLPELTEAERDALAEILKQHLSGYDHLFDVSFPYTMGWHGAPFKTNDTDHWQLHAHFFPPLLRSESVRKFMVGYEMLAETQRDMTAEQAASMLRETV
jgi:UDPglucose--hexose-1-phosphate uridylyltransferase